MSFANDYRIQLGRSLAPALGPEWKFYRTGNVLCCKASQGENCIVLSGTTKFSPFIIVEFLAGVKFAKATLVEQEIFKERSLRYSCHISRNWVNREPMDAKLHGPVSWDIDLRKPKNILKSLKRAIEQRAYPFFERFADMKAARNAHAKEKQLELVRGCWRTVLTLDVALNDLDHFEKWINTSQPGSALKSSQKFSAKPKILYGLSDKKVMTGGALTKEVPLFSHSHTLTLTPA